MSNKDRTSVLDPFRNKIIDFLELGLPKTVIAKMYGVHRNTLTDWLKKHKLYKYIK